VRRTGAALAVLVTVTALLGFGCAGTRIEDGVYRSAKGYSITLPGPAWSPTVDNRTDLQLVRPSDGAGMLANATCDELVARRRLEVLTRQVLVGLRDREVVEQDEQPLAGRPAAHAVVEGRMAPAEERLRVELFVVKGERCVYDLMYAAPPATFERWRPDFHRFAGSLTER
jgi:hypothetical protein